MLRLTGRRVAKLCKQTNLPLRAMATISTAERVKSFGASVFSEFTALCIEHKAVNLGQGFPDFEAPDFVKEAAQNAIAKDFNQYTRSAGHLPLVNCLSNLYSPLFNRKLDPLTEIVVTSGATEAGFATMQALLNPGDEVILMEPFYDAYPAWTIMAGGIPKFVPLRAPANARSAADWKIDIKELERAITPKTKVLLLNTPHNPVGKVFTRDELLEIGGLAKKHNLIIVSDEVYDFLVYDKEQHVRIASLPGLWERTVTLGSSGKTFSTTGWKIGWTTAPAPFCHAIAMAHQWIPFCVTTPMQQAVADAFILAQKNNYFADIKKKFESARGRLFQGLSDAGLNPLQAQGGYFILGNSSSLKVPVAAGQNRDYEVARWLIKNIGVGPIPPSAFYSPPHQHLAANHLRFAFCKRESMIDEACKRLKGLRDKTR